MVPNAKFCPQCGASLTGEKPSGAQASTRLRDIGIIVGVLIIMTAAYFILKGKPVQQQVARPQTQQQQPAGAQTAMPPDHPPVEGMANMPGMEALDSLPKDFNSLVMLGNQNMDHSNLPVAAECYRRALAIDSNQVDVRVDYGACLHGMGMGDRAVQEFRKALAMSPRHAIAHFNLGVVFMDIQQNDSAKVYFKKYLEIEPNGRAAADANRMLQQIGG
jgi:cytochrome c-type biogenesis protein CcmH/NrfG